LAEAGIFRARWTEEIHKEWMENLKERFSDLAIEDIQRIRGSCRMLKMLMFWPTPLKLERKSSSHSINVIFLTKLWKNSTSKLSTQTILFSTRKRSGVWSQSRLDGFAVASVAELSPLTSRQKRFACSSESFALRCEVGATVDDGTHGKRHPQIHDARPGVQFGRLVTGFEKERLSL
jgi:hypothetical protein